MKRVILFTKVRALMIVSSLLLILAGGVGLYLKGGFNLGIDFTAGLSQQIQIKPQAAAARIEDVRSSLSGIGKLDIQTVGRPENQEFIIKVIAPADTKYFQERMENRILELLSESFGEGNVVIKQSDFVGPRYSQELVGQTISIILVALVLILLYTAFRFHFIYATAAVICLIHDVLIMFGVLAVFQFEVTTTTIAAILTIIGYSLNDTIVIFDRIRENRSLMRDADLEIIINTSITQSLGRTVLTSLTTLLAVAAIYVFGTGTIRAFALNLIIGVVVGTYSTVFIASPIVLGWQRLIEKRRKKRDVQKFGRMPSVPSKERLKEALPAESAPGITAPEPAKAHEPTKAPEPASQAREERAGVRDEEARKPGAKVSVTRVQPSRKKPGKKKKKKK